MFLIPLFNPGNRERIVLIPPNEIQSGIARLGGILACNWNGARPNVVFLCPIYPVMRVDVAAVIESFCDHFYDRNSSEQPFFWLNTREHIDYWTILVLSSTLRTWTFSITNGYSAPLEIYKHFDHHDDAGTGAVVCEGSEWHHFPSSFFRPENVCEGKWIGNGFMAPNQGPTS
ncbi:Dol-P-Man:Man(6)GlcNAc(2)-PP-Dol alpha-1,2-mannosyltransferase [Tanacetum coccineum]